jgi:hypothetical protein
MNPFGNSEFFSLSASQREHKNGQKMRLRLFDMRERMDEIGKKSDETECDQFGSGCREGQHR